MSQSEIIFFPNVPADKFDYDFTVVETFENFASKIFLKN